MINLLLHFVSVHNLSVKKQTHIALRMKLEIIFLVSPTKWIHGFISYTSVENIGGECKSIKFFDSQALCANNITFQTQPMSTKNRILKSLRKLTIVSQYQWCGWSQDFLVCHCICNHTSIIPNIWFFYFGNI